MNQDVAAFAQVMVVIVCSLAGLVAVGLGARVLWKLGSRQQPAQLPSGAIDESHIERLEHAIDAIAIEVERISEAQRFTVGLLTEKSAAQKDALPAPRRPDTQH